MALKSKNGVLLYKDGHLCTTCCGPVDYLIIIYEWDPPAHDLDTGTTFLGETVGWACGDLANYMFWASGDNTEGGPEQVNVMVRQARANGRWSNSVEIHCAAGWYIPNGGSGPARLRVTFNGITQVKTIAPGAQNVCATTPVGIITVFDDWTFTLGDIPGGEIKSDFTPLAKARFAICKTCPDSTEDAFSCRLFSGCCFGQHRTTPTFKCPAGLW